MLGFIIRTYKKVEFGRLRHSTLAGTSTLEPSKMRPSRADHWLPSCTGSWRQSGGETGGFRTWVVVEIMAPFLGPYHNTAPIIFSKIWPLSGSLLLWQGTYYI